jgi:membrane protease YdiL (CAAX protease family)
MTLAAGSFGTILWLAFRLRGARPLLAYEPRRAVPWNFLAAALTVLLLPALMTLAVLGAPSETELESPAPISAENLWLYAGASVLSTTTLLAALAALCRAGVADLGLPRSWRAFGRDLRIGAVTFLAVLVPVYCLQWALSKALQPDQIHPLIEDLESNFTPTLLWAAVAMAVVAAPLYEETVFRLIFQGWLEKKEDQALGFSGAAPPSQVAPSGEDEALEPEPPAPAAPEPPATGMLPGLPHGWAPLLASAGLFSMAHLGHGVAPVSLLPLGVALGYVYQRTHRILPSMVCHMLFNGFSMTMLWLELTGEAAK